MTSCACAAFWEPSPASRGPARASRGSGFVLPCPAAILWQSDRETVRSAMGSHPLNLGIPIPARARGVDRTWRLGLVACHRRDALRRCARRADRRGRDVGTVQRARRSQPLGRSARCQVEAWCVSSWSWRSSRLAAWALAASGHAGLGIASALPSLSIMPFHMTGSRG